ncbi:Asp-tRNA(Asn)/Glu-tRNA(Gln) amidotransferase GatCAB subunit A [archaeon SCG-AAA382B04]|nr:Asp-tRNA(Asn)/Glu-tRNA(Gln) amidotransferase GatCAB subunit A [archaeon SCG-AAA382B04]
MNHIESILKIKKGELSSLEYLEKFIDQINKKEDEINAFITLNEEKAREKAKEIDKKINNGKEVGKLAGTPIAIKDSIITKNLRTTCGSQMLKDFSPQYDADVIKKIKKEDGIIIGKTNCDEFCMGTSTETSYFGPTHNPIDHEKVPGGSSGGSAAAIKYGASPFSLGSDTGGSVRCPASFCGTVGLKPTYGSISRYGLIAYASSLDQIGTITNTIEESAYLFDVIKGKTKNDSTSLKYPDRDVYEELDTDISQKTIGVPQEFFGEGVDQEVNEEVKKSIKDLEDQGAKIKSVNIPSMEYALAAYYLVAIGEASSNLARFDGVRYGHYSNKNKDWEDYFSEVRREGFGKEVKRRIMLGTYALSAGYYEKYYQKALKIRTLLKNDFERALNESDLLVAPTMPFKPFELGEKIEDPLSLYFADILTVPINMVGLPALSVPSKEEDIGIQIIGEPFSEGEILSTGKIIEEENQ